MYIEREFTNKYRNYECQIEDKIAGKQNDVKKMRLWNKTNAVKENDGEEPTEERVKTAIKNNSLSYQLIFKLQHTMLAYSCIIL